MSAPQRYEAALAAGDWPTAEAILRQALAEGGGQHQLLMLAGFLRKRGRLEEAEALLIPAVGAAPTVPLLDLLGLVQYERQSFAECEMTLERLVALAPDVDLSTYTLLSKVKSVRLGRQGGRDVMRRALDAHPGRTEFIAAYADTLPEADALAVFQNQLNEARGDPARMAYFLHRITAIRCLIARDERGLSREFGVSWPDTYQWADTEFLPQLKEALTLELASGSRRAGAWIDLASVAIAEGQWDLAEKYLAELRSTSKRTPAKYSAFGKEFHAEIGAMMTDADILAGLVELQYLASPPSRGDATVFMGSDPIYFERFTLPFLRQLETARIPLDVHVHILDGGEPEWREILAAVAGLQSVGVTLTAEASGAAAKDRTYAKIYYHAIRYVRCFQVLRRASRPMWVLDCDLQLLRDPRPLFSSIHAYDLALRTCPGHFSPSYKINASCVGIAPTALGLEFARRVAAYIIYWKDRGTWGWSVDQLSLFSAYAHMSDEGRTPSTLFLDNNAMNNKLGDTGMIRFLSGIDKHVAATAD